MDEMIDTSDAEERELMEAQKPGYYHKVWGALEHPDILQVIDDRVVSFPHALSQQRMQDTVDIDPSPNFSHMQISPTPGPVSSAFQVLPFVAAPDPKLQGRAYSLRHRSAKQLNPFEYDKRQYKHQLRGMPEAIVREPHLNRRIMRKERYSEEEGENDSGQDEADFEATEDGDEEWRVQEKRKASLQDRNALDRKMRELGIELAISDSECEALGEVVASEGEQCTEEDTRRMKRKRSLRVRKFPMAVGMRNIEPSSTRRQSTPPLGIPLRSLPRHGQSGPSQMSPELEHTISVDTTDVPMDIGPEFGGVSNVGTDEAVDRIPFSNQTGDPSLPTDRGDSFTSVSEDDEPRTRSRSRQLRRGRSGLDDSGVRILGVDTEESDHVISDHWSEDSGTPEMILTEKARKQLKALRRMMPAAFMNKLLTGKQDDSAKQRSNDRERHEEKELEDSPLQPGRGRKRMVSPGSRDPERYQIRGDTESESENQSSSSASGHETVVLEDDTADAEQVSEESDDRLDEDDIQTWLAPEPLEEAIQEKVRAPRMRRPESERDRPRTGDLIDRMLQRTRRVGRRFPRPLFRSKSTIKSPTFVTREVKRLGNGRGQQTKLAFPKMDKQQRKSSAKTRREASPVQELWEADVEGQDGKSRKNKKSKRVPVQTKLFIFRRDGHKVTSGRPQQIIYLDDDGDALHEALEPVESAFRTQAHQPNAGPGWTNNNHECRHETATGQDVFDIDMCTTGQRPNKILLDYNLSALRPGITLGSDGYVGKGRLFELISILKGDTEVPTLISATIYELEIGPDMPIAQMSPTFAAACDKLYDASTVAADDPDLSMVVKAADALMHVLCQVLTFKTPLLNDEEECLLVTDISEQIKHLIARIDERVELFSADGHSLDYRSFALHWFAVEVHMRLVHAHQKRPKSTEHASSITTTVAEQYSVQLMRRLLEYGLDRTIGRLQNGGQSLTTSTVRALELWICLFHVAPFFTNSSRTVSSKSPPFWRLVEAAMDVQSNKPDSRLFESERIWETTFSLCVISQFSVVGLSTSTVRMEAHWPIVKNALKCIRLSADERCDNAKPASTLQKRDTYLRLVTARCFLLCTRWKWRLDDAEDMFHELYAIFRSRNFSNLLGEPDDFPAFIQEYDEALFDTYQANDTAYGLFLKLIIRSAKSFVETDGTSRLRGMKLNRLLSLAVPVGSTSFTKAYPPKGQALSMLYNRYSAIFAAIYVDPSATHVRSRLQQIRRYITFKDADYDSRTAAIRSMMHVAILLHHLNKPLDDILAWGSEMIDDLIAEASPSQLQDDRSSRAEREKLIVLVQLLLGAIRTITSTPSISRSADQTNYPDVGLLQAWMPQLLSSPLAKDHRTGLEICKCTESFLTARRALIPIPSIPMHVNKRDSQDSQDEYGDGGLDLNDPALLDFLSGIEESPNQRDLDDQKASEILDGYSQPLYTCVCMHLGCKSTTFGGPYYEADQWLTCWLGFGVILVRNKRRDWDYYFQLGEYAWQSIDDPFRRIHLRIRFMLIILQLDAYVYKSHEDQILALWVESIVSPDITIENEFAARLFSVDGLQHAVLQNMPCAVDTGTGDFTFTLTEFREKRLPFIEAMLYNVSDTLDNEGAAGYVQLVRILLSTLQTWIKNGVTPKDYIEFSRKIVSAVRRHDTLTRDPALQCLLLWSGFL